MKTLALVIGLVCLLNAAIPPSAIIKTDAIVSDLVVSEGKMYVATDGDGVEIFDTKSFKKLSVLHIPNIKTLSGKSYSPKIYSVDHHTNMTVLVSESGGNFRKIKSRTDSRRRDLLWQLQH